MYCLPVGGENTLYIPTILSHICPETRVDEIWRSSLVLYRRECSICARPYWRERLNDSALCSISDESPNLEIKDQPSDTVSERKRHLAFTSFCIGSSSSSWCTEGRVVQTAKHISLCQISLRDFVLCSHHFLPGRWTMDVIFNPQMLLTLLQYPALATQAERNSSVIINSTFILLWNTKGDFKESYDGFVRQASLSLPKTFLLKLK